MMLFRYSETIRNEFFIIFAPKIMQYDITKMDKG